MIKRIALSLILLILSLSAPVFAQESGAGIIEGQIVNGTAGGSSVAEQDITLKTYKDEVEVGQAATRTDAEGRFAFSGLATGPGYRYDVLAKYQNAEYNSEQISFNEGETTKSTRITVYDATDSDEAVNVMMSHMIVFVEEESLLVKEYYLFLNNGDRTYVVSTDGVNTGALRFSLPEGATDMQATMGLMDCCIVPNEKGFVDTMPVLPGSKEIAYSYRVPQKSGQYTLSQILHYPTNRFDLLVQGEGIEINSEQLNPDEPMDISGTRFNHYSGAGFAAEAPLVINLAGLPQSSQSSFLWVVMALIIIGAGFSSVYLVRKRRPQPVTLADSQAQRQQRMMVELAELDDSFEEGNIPEEDYRRMRAEKKAALVELIRR